MVFADLTRNISQIFDEDNEQEFVIYLFFLSLLRFIILLVLKVKGCRLLQRIVRFRLLSPQFYVRFWINAVEFFLLYAAFQHVIPEDCPLLLLCSIVSTTLTLLFVLKYSLVYPDKRPYSKLKQ